MDHSTNLPCASSLMCLKIVISPRQRSSLTPHEQFSSIIPLFTVPNIQALSSKAGSTDKLLFAQEIKIIVITSLNCKSLDGRGHVFLIFLAKTLKMLCQEHTRYLITVCWMNEKKKTRFESSHHLVSRLEIVGRGSNLVTDTLLHLIFITILGNRQNDHLYFRKEKLRCQAIGLNLIADLRDSKAYALNRCTCLGNMGTCGMWGFSCSWVTPLFGYVGANRNNSWDIFSNILAWLVIGTLLILLLAENAKKHLYLRQSRLL